MSSHDESYISEDREKATHEQSSSTGKLDEFHVDISKTSMLLSGISVEGKGTCYPAEFRVDIPKISMAIQKERTESSESKENKITSIKGDKKTRDRYCKLYLAALRGDWKTADAIFNEHNDDINVKISKHGYTATHIAATAGHFNFMRKLLDMGGVDLLMETTNENHSPFCLVAMSGKVKTAKLLEKKIEFAALFKKEKRLEFAALFKKEKLLKFAALFGRKEMVKHLVKVTEGHQSNANENDETKMPKEINIKVLLNLIKNGLYETAIELVEKYPGLAKERKKGEEDGETALHVLAKIPIEKQQHALVKLCYNLCGKRLKDSLINLREQCLKASLEDSLTDLKERCSKLFPCLGYEFGPKKAPPAPGKLVKSLWESVIVDFINDPKIDSQISRLITKPEPLLSIAARHGNIEFINILINEYPDLIFEKDENERTIFHYAVMYRQNDIFKFIYEIGQFKDFILRKHDKEDNNILHLAGNLAPEDRLNTVSGAALQMQRELLWFEAVEELVCAKNVEAKNKEGKTPRALFTEKHRELREKGEKWIKDTASSCMIVATLIATVVFAAAFTVPGGTNETTGSPNFLHEVSFTVFVIADAISLVSSSCSVLTFLSLLTYRYTEKAFLFWLPTKLLFGLVTLLISIGSMMAVFCSTYFIVFKEEKLSRAAAVAGIASVPVIAFLYHQLPLFVDLVRSTYFSFSLFRPSLFGRSKLTLSYKNLEANGSKKGE